MCLIVITWLILILWKCEYNRTGEAEPFSKQNALALKGICAMEILIGHLGIATESIFLFPNRKAGILFVGVFFALSGYGLAYSVENKQGYLNGFLVKRLPKIIIPAYSVYAIRIVIELLLYGNRMRLLKLVNAEDIFFSINWYIWELAIFYLIFYICVRLGTLRKMHWYILISSTGFILVAYGMGADNPWYGSTLCFWLGIFYFLHQDKWKIKFTGKSGIGVLFFSGTIVILGIGAFFVLGTDSFIGNVIGRNLASFFFVVCVIILLYRFRIGNRASLFLGKYSFEIFLFHPMVISICRPYMENDFAFSVIVIVITIGASVCYQNVVKYMVRQQ